VTRGSPSFRTVALARGELHYDPRSAATSGPGVDMTYFETRSHELRKRSLLMIDGKLTGNLQATEGGASVRVQRDGYWGFAAVTGPTDAAVLQRLRDQASRNAQAMASFGAKAANALPGGAYQGRHVFRGRAPIAQAELVQRLEALNAWCRQRYPRVTSVRLRAEEERHTKQVANSLGSDALTGIERGAFYVTLTMAGADGAPVELGEPFSTKGSLADLALSPEGLQGRLDALYAHLQAKAEAVPARGGIHTVVMAPELAGILAHEAMGHPCEADLVLGGAVTGQLVGQRVASDLVGMVDVAHTFRGQETMVPVYCDDEGTPGQDAVLIERGILKGFMSSRETAAQLGIPATGSARAYAPSDEPLVRMRNTVILPGASRLEDMIAGVDDGYYLMRTSNGQADSTTEFMFGITLGYEIRGGKLGRAIRDTTVSGSAIKVLQSVDAVSSDVDWNAAGYCGKKQVMVVSMGGPALRAQAHLGGQ
jgi:TldD protein